MPNVFPWMKKKKVLVKKDAKSSSEHGCEPEQRKVKDLINYGIVNIDKPSGPSSHQVSSYVKNILHIKKAGHSGTLDPKVTGVLPVALGRGTRIVQSLLPAGKEYVCLMRIHNDYDEKKLRKIIKGFVGEIDQLPPVRSAVKRQQRKRTIYFIDIIEIAGKNVLFRTGCQAGTYIRKLCLHPNTEIISKHSIIFAKNFFISPKEVYTMANKKITQKFPSEIQKFKFKGKLLKFTMSSGISFLVTPEHKMLVSLKEGYKMVPAFWIKPSNFIVKSLNYIIPEKKMTISDLLDDKYLIDQKEIKKLVKNAFIKKHGSIRAMNRELNLDRKAFLENSEIAIPLSHIKKADLYEQIKDRLIRFKTEKGTKISFSRLTNDFMYLVGLIASDGSNTKEKRTIRYTRIKFHNKNKRLINEFKKKYKKIFPEFNLSENRRNDGLIELDSSNSFFATLCANLGVKSPHKNSDLLPILYLNNNLIASFLKGYFDGDGSAHYKKKVKIKGTYTEIKFHTVSEINVKRIHQMLLKLNISNIIVKRKGIYDISINSLSSKKEFISKISSNHPLKKEKLELIEKHCFGENKDNLYIGFHYKKYLAQNISSLRKLGGNIGRIIKTNVPITRGLYLKAKKLCSLPLLDEFCIEKIKKIEKIDYSGLVYDMTVPQTHNFFIETGFVSSNCSDMGAKLGTGAHMLELRRTRAGPFSEETICTLQDLTDAYYYFKEKNNDKELRKLVVTIEAGVRHLSKVWVLDSTVDTLCHGAFLNVPGISRIEEGIKTGDKVAVMTLKDELVSVGIAQMSTQEVMEKNKGLFLKHEQVFMSPGVYTGK